MEVLKKIATAKNVSIQLNNKPQLPPLQENRAEINLATKKDNKGIKRTNRMQEMSKIYQESFKNNQD
uniref:Uncharacterized protein n=1 Tax=Cucumis melo TaxID=3656 RepID=A0A9I9DTV6_CUCME